MRDGVQVTLRRRKVGLKSTPLKENNNNKSTPLISAHSPYGGFHQHIVNKETLSCSLAFHFSFNFGSIQPVNKD